MAGLAPRRKYLLLETKTWKLQVHLDPPTAAIHERAAALLLSLQSPEEPRDQHNHMERFRKTGAKCGSGKTVNKFLRKSDDLNSLRRGDRQSTSPDGRGIRNAKGCSRVPLPKPTCCIRRNETERTRGSFEGKTHVTCGTDRKVEPALAPAVLYWEVGKGH